MHSSRPALDRPVEVLFHVAVGDRRTLGPTSWPGPSPLSRARRPGKTALTKTQLLGLIGREPLREVVQLPWAFAGPTSLVRTRFRRSRRRRQRERMRWVKMAVFGRVPEIAGQGQRQAGAGSRAGNCARWSVSASATASRWRLLVQTLPVDRHVRPAPYRARPEGPPVGHGLHVAPGREGVRPLQSAPRTQSHR